MTWLHYTDIELKSIKPKFKQEHFKPRGLWCSYNTEWLDWCIDNGFSTFDTDNYYLYEIKINVSAKILKIDSYETYEKILGYGDKLNWEKVTKDYDGIEILNYQEIKSYMREKGIFDTFIYSLDCSCCCIWNPVFSFTQIKKIE